MKTAAKVLAVVVILGLAVGTAVMLVKSRPEPKRGERRDRGVLVAVDDVEVTPKRIDIEVRGEVQPAESVSLQPQVAGKVVWVSEKLVAGGIVDRGEPLVRIERSDYELQVAQQETAVEQARANLRLEEGQQRVAKREWELFNEEVADSVQNPSLALREPQQKIAEVNLDAAKSRLEKARLDLQRTTIRAPFNAYVRSENVGVGQQASPQVSMAQLIGTDEFWVTASVPVDQLDFVAIPGVNTEGDGSRVRVVQHAGNDQIERTGRVVRMLGDLDPAGRMARIVIEIQDPFQLDVEGTRGLPMLIGAFVHGFVDGSQKREVAVIERRAVHEGDEVWIYRDGKLDIRRVSQVWGGDEVVYVTGLKDGDRYVTSPIATPVEGMKLRLEPDQDSAEPRAEADAAPSDEDLR